ncbi:MAG TPA: hypothetical protein VN794_21840 [Methylomirabilota bacterium]|nr:hypothetical protein [Methylomirabilota bacterium]
MYLPSDTDLMADQRASRARHELCNEQNTHAMRCTSAKGRAALFQTVVSPDSVGESLGVGAALDTARLQSQTETARAVAILGTSGSGAGESVQEIIRNAPEVVSLNRGSNCGILAPVQQQRTVNPVPRPGMPQRAPAIVQTPQGPLNFVGAPSTVPGAVPEIQGPVFLPGKGGPAPAPYATQYYKIENNLGLTGYAPPWSDAWVTETQQNQQGSDMGVASWISANPWLALAIAGAGVFALSKRRKK